MIRTYRYAKFPFIDPFDVPGVIQISKLMKYARDAVIIAAIDYDPATRAIKVAYAFHSPMITKKPFKKAFYRSVANGRLEKSPICGVLPTEKSIAEAVFGDLLDNFLTCFHMCPNWVRTLCKQYPTLS